MGCHLGLFGTVLTLEKASAMAGSGGRNAHVSHRMGNSLCSHPALLMSALGGIFGEEDGVTNRKKMEDTVKQSTG
jgi:hypothetical protein